MKHFLKAAGVLLATLTIGAGALAQTLQTPQVVRPDNADIARLTDQIRSARDMRPFPALAGSFVAPTLDALAIRRKLGALQALGLTVGSGKLGAPVHLAPLRHRVDASTYMAFDASRPPQLALPPASSLNGAVTLNVWTTVELNFRASSPFQYHLVECVFEGASLESLAIQSYIRDSGTFPVQAWPDIRLVPVRNGRAAILMEPRPDLQRRLTFGAGSDGNDYVFAGCEITPVSP